MKYTYVYKSSDGVRHEASMKAESREAVFETLRKQGVRAIKVTASDGSKANGEVRGVRKRVVFAVAILVALIAGSSVFFLTQRSSQKKSEANFGVIGNEIGKVRNARPLARQTIPGDRKRISEACEKAFRLKAEKFLARFVEPGRPAIAPEVEWPSKTDFDVALANVIVIGDNEMTEYKDVKRIVTGIKREMREYLDAGGLVSGYIKELIKRQKKEALQRSKVEVNLKKLLKDDEHLSTAYDYWLKANAQLQSMGIYQLPIPDELSAFSASISL